MKDYLKLHFIVIILGFTAILGRLTEASVLNVVLYRTLLASVGLWLVAKFRGKNLRITFREMLPFFGIGIIMTVHWFCFFGSARLSTVAISLVTFSTTSFFTSILEPLTRKKKISWVEVLLGVLVVIGMYVVFSFESRYILAIIIGVIGAILSSIYSVSNGLLTHKYDALIVTFYEMLGAFLAALVLTPIMTFFVQDLDFQWVMSWKDWLWISVLGLVCTVYPYIEIVELLKKISAFTLTLSINMEPIYGILLAYLIFGEKEKMTTGFYIGGVLILLSVFLHPLLRRVEKNTQNK